MKLLLKMKGMKDVEAENMGEVEVDLLGKTVQLSNLTSGMVSASTSNADRRSPRTS